MHEGGSLAADRVNTHLAQQLTLEGQWVGHQREDTLQNTNQRQRRIRDKHGPCIKVKGAALRVHQGICVTRAKAGPK